MFLNFNFKWGHALIKERLLLGASSCFFSSDVSMKDNKLSARTFFLFESVKSIFVRHYYRRMALSWNYFELDLRWKNDEISISIFLSLFLLVFVCFFPSIFHASYKSWHRRKIYTLFSEMQLSIKEVNILLCGTHSFL